MDLFGIPMWQVAAFFGLVLILAVSGTVMLWVQNKQRTKHLAQLATRIGWGFQAVAQSPPAQGLRILSEGRDQRVANMLWGERDGMRIAVFDLQYTLKEKELHQQTVLHALTEHALPAFTVTRRSFLGKLGVTIGSRRLEIEEQFDKEFEVRGEAGVAQLFTPQVRQYLLDNPFTVEAYGGAFVIYTPGQLASVRDVERLIDHGTELLRRIPWFTKF